MRLVQQEKQRQGRTPGIQFSQLKSLDSELPRQLKETLPPSLFEKLNGLLSPDRQSNPPQSSEWLDGYVRWT